MKNYIWLSIALTFVCLQLTGQTINLSLNSKTPQYVATGQQKTPKTTKEVNESILSNILVDTLGNKVHEDSHVGKSNVLYFSQIVDTAIATIKNVASSAWDAVFEEDRKKSVVDMNAFDLANGRTARKAVIETPTGVKEVTIAPQPVVVFDNTGAKITVMYDSSGNLVPIPEKPKPVPAPKKIETETGGVLVAKSFGIEVAVSDLDSIFNSESAFVYKGDVFKKVSRKEFDEEIKEPAKRKLRAESIPKSRQEYIDRYMDYAIQTQKSKGIPYQITLAQGVLESNSGKSTLAVKENNHFGIKCHGGRCNKEGCNHGYYTDDRKDETFEHHNSVLHSFIRHAEFLSMYDRYDRCFRCGDNLGCWAKALDIAEYATDKMYGRKLVALINALGLADYYVEYPK